MKRGDVCRCISDFTGMLPEEINIYKNDIVQVHSVVDRHWMEVEGGGAVGRVPSSVLVNADLPQHPCDRPLFVAAADFLPSQDGDLGFARGDFIIGLNPIDDAWWCGEIYGKKGIFPLNFVWKINKNIMEFEDTSEKPVKLKGRVKMSLRAQLPEELDLYAGDVIDITHIVDKDWYRGESNGATGIFPSGFVEILETDSVPSPSLPSQEINLPHECPSIDYTNSGGSYFAEETRPSFSSTADYFDIVDHVTLDHDQINAKPSMTPTSISEVTPVLSRTSTHWKTIDAVDDVDLLEDEYFKQNMPGLFASSSANKTTLSLHNNTKTIIPPVSSYDNIKPVIPPLSQASASDSFTKVKPRYENVIDSTSIEIGLRDSSSSFPDSYTCIANSENASPVANSNIKSRYENVENSPSIFTSNIQECALSMNQDVTSGDVLNSLSQKVEDYFASNLINNNSETSNTELDCKSHLLKQYSTLSSPGYNEDNTGIEPYGRAVFSFSAQYPNELTFKKGDIIHLLKHIDSHWTLGKLGDSRGIFPTSYVDVIVDCQHQYVEEELFLARCDSVAHPSYLGHAKAVYSFEGDQTGDVSMSKGDILKVLRSVDDNWAFVENMNGSKGMCPKNYLSMLIDMTADQNNVMSQSDESCSRLSRQLVQDPPSSRSRSTSPYDTSGSRRSYSKDDFGIIKKQEVDSVLAKNIASLDIATRGCHTDKREKESVFAEREANEQVLDDKPMTSPSNKTNNAFHTKPPLIDRTLSLPPVPPRNKIRREISIQPQSNSNGSTRSTLGASGKEPSCEVSDEPIYSKVQKPLQLGASTKVRLQDKPSLEFSINRTSMTRGDSSNSAAFPDDVSTLSNEKTYSSVVHNGSTSPAVLPQRPAPPPPPKIGDATYEEIEEYYSLPAKDEIKEGDRVLQAESSSLQQVVSTSIVTNNENMSVPLEDGAANNTESETSGINIESEVKACAKVDIRRELMQEIVTTEHEYIHDLEALIQVIRLAPSQKESQAVDLDTLMGNLTQVVSIAKKLLSHLDHVAYESDDSLRIGRVFLLCASDLCEVYKIYCSNHNVAAEPLLRKYAEEPTAAAFLQWVLSELQQHKIQLMDMRSVLIKPVQRVLKYPLFLDRLVTETPPDHADYQDLVEAKSKMANVAKEINEYTKRLDLINKYRTAADHSLQSKMQRVSMHSVAKKSARFSAIVSEKLGIMSTTKDPDFDEEETKFRCVQRSAIAIVRDIKELLKGIKMRHCMELAISEALTTVLIEGAKTKEMEAVHRVAYDSYSRLFQMFENFVNKRIGLPAKQLVSLCEVPERLIAKRYDKVLDFDNAQYRLDKNKDPTRTRILEEELSQAKGTYEALNTQLMMELPVLTSAGTEILTLAVRSLIAARMYLQGHMAKLYLHLAQVPELSFSGDEEMLTQFRVKYLHQVGEFRHLRFIPTETLQTSLPRSKVKGKKSLDNTSVAKPGATEGSKRKVLSRYPSDVIYIVSEVHTPGEVMELTLYPGDHVALLKNKDPLGRCDRWFVDDGENKGFARASCLKPYKPSDHQVGTVTALPSSISTAVPLPPAHPASIPRPSTLPRAAPTPPLPERPPRYEDLFPSVPVARDRPSQPVGSNSYNRAAPPPRYSLGQEVSVSSAQTPLPSKAGHRDSAPGSNGHSHVSESDYYAPPLDRQQSNEYNSPVSEENNIYEEIDQGITKPVSEEDSVHTDESPIYEAIEDRNHPYQNLGADGNDIKATEHPLPDSEVDEPKFYYAMYNFGGSDGTQLNLLAGQVVLLVEAKSSDWWFVEDRHGNQGYVPASYLAKYT